MSVHVVTGAGPVGSTVALQLAEAGEQVRLLTRSGSGPEHPLIDRRRVDVSRRGHLDEAFAGALAVHHCIHGSAYDARVWRAELPVAERMVLDAAGRAGAVVTFPESLYSYGPVDGPITEDLPRAATTGKLGVRTDLLAQREASATPTVSVAASDFYGPLVRNAHAGERMVPTVLAGRTMRVLGSPDQPHSFTYVPDLAAAMIAAAAREDLWNSFLHAPTAPALTQRQLVERTARTAGVPVPKVSSIPLWVLRASGVVSREMRELAETSYMFTAPFVLDSTASEQRLGLAPTPMDDGLAATVAWWRTQERAAA
ncbi:NAD-dependent epimerase/dehydratase family protein [Microbacterium sp. ARD31]|uniref:NAD-dependent epimerase/dehydratase family protein n=1 Tax=Microbacterium sp. ARD31 TaxID=2962576 RepID=UPI0028828227|nr:NAD-dependent epimerase/dehydratase family protein [Microbacterium sp. ARD31]MDT0188576.1 NAD-dependent epimerase/dehydratase family protein [Microbacterium sp. ARD31]